MTYMTSFSEELARALQGKAHYSEPAPLLPGGNEQFSITPIEGYETVVHVLIQQNARYLRQDPGFTL